MWRIGPLFLAALVACGSGESGNGDANGATSDARIQGPLDAAQPTAVRFIVMGDVGTGSQKQKDVAAQIKTKCDAEGCDFVILLGDNFYDSGVDGIDDSQWQDKFETPYAAIDLPFYAVLGNHDYGGDILGFDQGGLGNEFDKGLNEVAYSKVNPKWIMPSTYYTFVRGNVGFIMLDTNSILWDDTTHGDQRAWYQTALSEVSDADWVIAVGHHPYLSNGSHGNAGSYESIEILGTDIAVGDLIGPFLPQMAGTHVKDFLDQVVCGTVDVVFAGHDHNRQWLDENDKLCGAELIVAGAGAKTTAEGLNNNAVHWQDFDTPGFLYVVIDGNAFHGQFIDINGVMNFERSFTR